MRLIDADALKKGFSDQIKFIIDHAPTVDAVEVVRCKDCKYSKPTICAQLDTVVKPYDFCSYGERRYENAAD